DEPLDTVVLEYRRRVRTLAGNLQLLALAPEVLKPWHPLFVRFLSHKILRVLSPLFFLGLIGGGLWVGQPAYVAVAVGLLSLYGVGVLGLVLRSGLLEIPASFVVYQAAAVEALFTTRRTAANLWTR
ncbi:MAG: hypothetical protein ACOC3J_07010, partial [Gemmatimonadota bacterium]